MSDEATDNEFKVMQVVYSALESLPEENARKRVIEYVVDRLGLQDVVLTTKTGEQAQLHRPGIIDAPHTSAAELTFESFAELFDATQPDSNSHKALVSAYWCQVCQAAEDFDSQQINAELKNMGHGIANITNAIEPLKNQRPALVLQIRKSGSSQQARKTYKMTVAGKRLVNELVANNERKNEREQS
jgi:hypothetical protein